MWYGVVVFLRDFFFNLFYLLKFYFMEERFIKKVFLWKGILFIFFYICYVRGLFMEYFKLMVYNIF